jgi:adenylosuccinate lyase
MQQLAFRYATEQMRSIWSENRKFITWRQLWIALAEAQYDQHLNNSAGERRITQEQIAQLRSKVRSFMEDPSELQRLSAIEKECRHDVVAHIRLLGELCPLAKEIIHLGATSCDITDNADLILIRESFVLLRHRLVGLIDSLTTSAEETKSLPCVAYTHFQPAQCRAANR